MPITTIPGEPQLSVIRQMSLFGIIDRSGHTVNIR
jgi:hypothetical protein